MNAIFYKSTMIFIQNWEETRLINNELKTVNVNQTAVPHNHFERMNNLYEAKLMLLNKDKRDSFKP